MTGTASAFGVALIAVLWAYDGWQYVPFAAGEIRQPQKNIPRALTSGVLAVVSIFVAVNLAYLHALSAQQMKGLLRVGEGNATAMAGPAAGQFISLAVLISAFGCCAAMLLVCTRLFFAMARSGVFPKRIGRVHQKYGTPSALERNAPITSATPFHVASVSKQFTAAAIVLLAQQGKLSVDGDMRKYVPELPDFGVRITLRNLLHHTSGLRDQWDFLKFAGWRYSQDLITNQDVLDVISRQKELNFQPGDRYLYSNTGYAARRGCGKSDWKVAS